MKRPLPVRFRRARCWCSRCCWWCGRDRSTWGGSGRSNPGQTLIFWAISSLIFVLMVMLGWILFRTGVKLYVERQSNREGSRIRTKLVVGALTLSIVPVFFLVLFSVDVLNRNMMAWFTAAGRPAVAALRGRRQHAEEGDARRDVGPGGAAGGAAGNPPGAGRRAPRTEGFLERFCREQELVSAAIFPPDGGSPLDAWGPTPRRPAKTG